MQSPLFSFWLAKKLATSTIFGLYCNPFLSPRFCDHFSLSRLIRNVRRPLSLLLMLFLLLTQQATLTHAVSHLAPADIAAAAQEVSSDSTEFAAHDCALCVAAAQFAAAIPAPAFQIGAEAATSRVYLGPPARSFTAAPALAFRSRAPPFA